MMPRPPGEQNLRRHRLLVCLLFSGLVDGVTSADLRALACRLEQAIDSTAADAAAPDPSVWGRR